MKTNDSGNRSKMAKIDTFQFEAVDNDKLVDDIRREEEARLNKKGVPAGEREYHFYTTNSVKRVDTQTVHRVMNTTGTGPIYSTTGTTVVRNGGRRPAKKRSPAAIFIPLAIILAYIIAVVAVDIMGLLDYRFGLTPVSVVLYVLYIALSLLGVMLLMFMDMLPKPLALLVLFVSLFCVHGNLYLMIPLVLAFIGIAITVEGNYTRIVACAIAVFTAFYAVVLGFGAAKVTRTEPVVSDDGRYQLVLEMTDDGKELTYAFILETRGTVYKRYVIEEKYVEKFYFGEDETVTYGESDEYGRVSVGRVVEIEDIIN